MAGRSYSVQRNVVFGSNRQAFRTDRQTNRQSLKTSSPMPPPHRSVRDYPPPTLRRRRLLPSPSALRSRDHFKQQPSSSPSPPPSRFLPFSITLPLPSIPQQLHAGFNNRRTKEGRARICSSPARAEGRQQKASRGAERGQRGNREDRQEGRGGAQVGG